MQKRRKNQAFHDKNEPAENTILRQAQAFNPLNHNAKRSVMLSLSKQEPSTSSFFKK